MSGPIGRQEQKQIAAHAALEWIEPGAVIGVGSGTTTQAFIDALIAENPSVDCAAAASRASASRLEAGGIRVCTLADLDRLTVYVDGADEVDLEGRAIKGGGAAQTREKALATAAGYWVCIVDASKVSHTLGRAPVPLEVESWAVRDVIAAMELLGAKATLREGVLTDDGNPVVDVRGLDLSDPEAVERGLESVPGVVCSGVFAKRRADVILIGRADGGVGRIAPKR